MSYIQAPCEGKPVKSCKAVAGYGNILLTGPVQGAIFLCSLKQAYKKKTSSASMGGRLRRKAELPQPGSERAMRRGPPARKCRMGPASFAQAPADATRRTIAPCEGEGQGREAAGSTARSKGKRGWRTVRKGPEGKRVARRPEVPARGARDRNGSTGKK